jgi:carbon monoxide dehydrogenase subunit G
MGGMSHFKSRKSRLNCTAEEVFRFVTDIRNFERFLPEKSVSNWTAEKESCSFSVPMAGTVKVMLTEKVEFSKVVFNGDALKENDFTLLLHISENSERRAEVEVELEADLNPMLKMMASKPIAQFLEMLVKEMEAFSDWKNLRE